MTIGTNIKRLRVNKGVTQEQLGDAVGVSSQAVSKWENNLEFDVIMGLAYHGIAFSAAIACAMFNKYGITADYCFDRKVADSKGRILCGYTLKDGDKVVIVDDLMSTGLTL